MPPRRSRRAPRLYGAAALFGATLHSVVRRSGLDRQFALLRFNNQWHYLFSEGPNESAVLVTVSCKHQDHSCLYAGILHSYDFTSEGQLERIMLTPAARAELPAAPSLPPCLSPFRVTSSLSRAET